jgi:hypothetical protein
LVGTSILDLAPTILSYFGITPPNYMNGRVLSELRQPAAKAAPLQINSEVSLL